MILTSVGTLSFQNCKGTTLCNKSQNKIHHSSISSVLSVPSFLFHFQSYADPCALLCISREVHVGHADITDFTNNTVIQIRYPHAAIISSLCSFNNFECMPYVFIKFDRNGEHQTLEKDGS